MPIILDMVKRHNGAVDFQTEDHIFTVMIRRETQQPLPERRP